MDRIPHRRNIWSKVLRDYISRPMGVPRVLVDERTTRGFLKGQVRFKEFDVIWVLLLSTLLNSMMLRAPLYSFFEFSDFSESEIDEMIGDFADDDKIDFEQFLEVVVGKSRVDSIKSEFLLFYFLQSSSFFVNLSIIRISICSFFSFLLYF